MRGASAIFGFLRDAASDGRQTVLVTLVDVIGSASRERGTHMAVADDGTYAGSLSGGCVEAAVVAEALDVLRRGKAELVRFGAGSRYLDIRLPCGGGIDLLFTPDPSQAVVAEIVGMLGARRVVPLLLKHGGGIAILDGAGDIDRRTGFVVTHEPDLRLVVVGHGAEVVSLARLGAAHNARIEVLSPDRATLEAAGPFAERAAFLPTPDAVDAIDADGRTAVIFLFHDHDWEPALMAAALRTDAFYIGAMGSRRTHETRIDALVDGGVDPSQAERIIGPIGLIRAARDPDTLALSILAQVADAVQRSAMDVRRPRDADALMSDVHEAMPS